MGSPKYYLGASLKQKIYNIRTLRNPVLYDHMTLKLCYLYLSKPLEDKWLLEKRERRRHFSCPRHLSPFAIYRKQHVTMRQKAELASLFLTPSFKKLPSISDNITSTKSGSFLVKYLVLNHVGIF